MTLNTPKLHIICGKIASGKSTCATELSRHPNTIVISEDEWADTVFSGQITTIADYMQCTSRLRKVIGPHVVALLNAGVSVVLDFQANTLKSRAWMRDIIVRSGADHVLHFLDVPDAVCIARLQARNASGDHQFTVTEAQFHQMSAHFVAPSQDEGFNVIRHTTD